MRKDWEYKKLGEVCTIERGGSPRPITDFITNDSNGINWIKIGDTKERSKYITSTKEKIKPEGVKKSRFVHKGDFILSNSMSFGRPYILDIDGCIHDGWLVIHDGKKFFSKDYLYYLLASPIMYSRFSQLAVGGVVNNLNSALVRKVIVPIPPISIQLSIANELDKINELIQLKKQQLKDYDQLAQSIFYEMFGDPVENEKGWEVKKISEVSIYYNGKAHENDIDESGKYILINSKFISSEGSVLKRTATQHFPLYKNDVVMVLSDLPNGKALGKCCLITKDDIYSLNQRICCFRGFKGDSHFFKYMINRHPYFLSFDDGKGQTNLRKKDVENCPIPLPPLPLQQQFAARIEAIERQKQQVSETIKDLETLLASRMQYWFD